MKSILEERRIQEHERQEWQKTIDRIWISRAVANGYKIVQTFPKYNNGRAIITIIDSADRRKIK